MNATTIVTTWGAMLPARWMRLKRRTLGLALYEALRRPGLPAPTANAHARFEYEARGAAREWLML